MYLQDKYDDIVVGVKSTAIKFGEQTPICLSCFATAMTLCLAYSGWLCHQTWPYYAALGGIVGHLSHQIYTLDINDREDCARKFLSNRWIGLLLFLGTVGGTYLKEEDSEVKEVTAVLSQAAQTAALVTAAHGS
jgi:4-hydroxybenzoate polyprenyltransferase